MRNQSCRKFRLFVPLIILAVLALFTFAVFSLWNNVLAHVIDVKTISYWQALGILVLARILFGGFPGRRGRPFGPPWRGQMMMERWQSLTPDQREELRRRFGDWPCPSWQNTSPPQENTGGPSTNT
ncbi:MAG TPA: hypothetical protein VG722_06195 [Tepidisphaeraceae bacterium]|nr:hypothetical protein [Tepidisphaeraceae bacterium]